MRAATERHCFALPHSLTAASHRRLQSWSSIGLACPLRARQRCARPQARAIVAALGPEPQRSSDRRERKLEFSDPSDGQRFEATRRRPLDEDVAFLDADLIVRGVGFQDLLEEDDGPWSSASASPEPEVPEEPDDSDLPEAARFDRSIPLLNQRRRLLRAMRRGHPEEAEAAMREFEEELDRGEEEGKRILTWALLLGFGAMFAGRLLGFDAPDVLPPP
eukprot:tig00021127_g18856.t1